jgi:hypothetical protein
VDVRRTDNASLYGSVLGPVVQGKLGRRAEPQTVFPLYLRVNETADQIVDPAFFAVDVPPPFLWTWCQATALP